MIMINDGTYEDAESKPNMIKSIKRILLMCLCLTDPSDSMYQLTVLTVMVMMTHCRVYKEHPSSNVIYPTCNMYKHNKIARDLSSLL